MYCMYLWLMNICIYACTCVLLCFSRGDEQHDQLAIAYHLLLDSRSSDKPKTKPLPTANSSTADLASSATFSMVGGASDEADAPTIKKQVRYMLHVYVIVWAENMQTCPKLVFVFVL